MRAKSRRWRVSSCIIVSNMAFSTCALIESHPQTGTNLMGGMLLDLQRTLASIM